jgi:hypothetical protein
MAILYSEGGSWWSFGILFAWGMDNSHKNGSVAPVQGEEEKETTWAEVQPEKEPPSATMEELIFLALLEDRDGKRALLDPGFVICIPRWMGKRENILEVVYW